MLVLTRKAGERIVIGDSIVVEVREIHTNRVRLGIQAPSEVAIFRQELVPSDEQAPAHPAGESPPEQANTQKPNWLVSLRSSGPESADHPSPISHPMQVGPR
jgi:carbon storage regulator